ncbi:adenosine deaminase/editase [Truncatella angustata]|uniref:Adenosine deaminase/editase n=1 Tax=Truncatella angustata TaxID=152316 RepID=A0A9P8ZT29_9PEZI|nr:adenosine deaminase/editase [Truncatella angustata]KAH6648725.1 adenosine deaminase/editase [Truncatella angustata]
MTVTPDIIASLVLHQFDQLPTKRKPLVRDNGVHEWVPLSGIVAQDKDNKLTCLSLATGMKCLPRSKLPKAQGNVLHDWHAEVLAIRAFNRFVLDEVESLSKGTATSSPYLRRRDEAEVLLPAGGDGGSSRQQQPPTWHAQPFAWREDVRLHMYCSEAPCGDASMELTMAAQDDASPWEVSPAALGPSSSGPVPGRSYFSHLGAVRLKPARADAPSTMSKSCSDKMASAECTSLLSSLASMFVCPSNAYLSSVILPTSQYSSSGCSRAFSSDGRMGGVEESQRSWGGGYRFQEFAVNTTDLEFKWSKRSVEARVQGEKGKLGASNLAVAWTGRGLEETTLGGTLQGRKAFDPKGASVVSRRRMWALSLEIAGVLGISMVLAQKALASQSYKDVKGSKLFEARRQVKQDVRSHALKGWARNEGDDNFSLEL